MHKLVVLYPEPADPDHFRDYYVTHHLPLVTLMPGLLAWRYGFDVADTSGLSSARGAGTEAGTLLRPRTMMIV
jgi:uncharacterized protein (TIGR02118 family)